MSQAKTACPFTELQLNITPKCHQTPMHAPLLKMR
jgi:hypothetical protein